MRRERGMAQLLMVGAVLLVAGSAIHVVTALTPREPVDAGEAESSP